MIQPVTASQSTALEPKENKTGLSALWGRVTRDWNTALIFGNTALALAAMAILFFMDYPALAIGMGVYGIAYVTLNILANKTSASNMQNAQEKHEKLWTKLALLQVENSVATNHVGEREEVIALLQEALMQAETVTGNLRDEITRLNLEITALRGEIQESKETMQAMQASVQSLPASFGSSRETLERRGLEGAQIIAL